MVTSTPAREPEVQEGRSGSQNTVHLDNPVVTLRIVLLINLGLFFGLRSRRNIAR
jgi:hypothetical protein